MAKSRTRELLENFLSFALGGFSVKILAIFMLPLYTYFLSPADFALTDLVNLSIQLAIPTLTLSVTDALLRFGLDEQYDRERVVGTSLAILAGAIVLAVPVALLVGALYSWTVALFAFGIFVFQAMSSFFSAYFKCIDLTRRMVAISTGSSLVIIILNVLFIAGLKLGLTGYWLANVVGYGIGVLAYSMLGGVRVFRSIRTADRNTARKLLTFAVPLMPNAVFWWANSSIDRYLLTALTSLSAVGLYSVAAKIPLIGSTLSGFFFQAWNITAFKGFGSKDNTRYFSKAFSLLLFVVFLVSLGLIVTCRLLARVLFSSEFYQAWTLIPLLVIAVGVSTMNSFLGSVFTSSLKTGTIFVTTAVGSVSNILLNLVFIWKFGVAGAAIGTTCGYVMVYALRMIILRRRHKEMHFPHRHALLALLLLFGVSGLVLQEGPIVWVLLAALGGISVMIAVSVKAMGGLPLSFKARLLAKIQK